MIYERITGQHLPQDVSQFIAVSELSKTRGAALFVLFAAKFARAQDTQALINKRDYVRRALYARSLFTMQMNYEFAEFGSNT